MKNILTSILTSILFFAFSANSFFFSKTKQFRKEIGGVNIDVYEARDKKKSMLFFSGGFGKIPHFIYSDFLNRLNGKQIWIFHLSQPSV